MASKADIKQSAGQPSLIAVDWGTTKLRAYLVDALGGILDERSSDDGLINAVGGFASTLKSQIGGWLADEDDGLPVLMAGMVGSRNGWAEAPYAPCPASAETLASSLTRVWISPQRAGWIVPGVCGQSVSRRTDVMRGEETQVVGLLDQAEAEDVGVICLPGTHNKWVRVQEGAIRAFSTTMAGELFSSLVKHTILSLSASDSAPMDPIAFDQGVDASREPGGLQHHLFSVRTRHLFREVSDVEGAAYLSGLLIGDEIEAMHGAGALATERSPVTVVASEALAAAYLRGLNRFGFKTRWIASGQAVRAGLLKIARIAGLVDSSRGR